MGAGHARVRVVKCGKIVHPLNAYAKGRAARSDQPSRDRDGVTFHLASLSAAAATSVHITVSCFLMSLDAGLWL